MSPRLKQQRRLVSPPILQGFKPIGIAFADSENIALLYEEYEAFRLSNYSAMKQEQAAELMHVSRPTFTRIYNSALRKIAKAFTEGCSIVIEGGDVSFDKQWYRCQECHTVFHCPAENPGFCISCESREIEHINKRIREWSSSEAEKTGNLDRPKEYCTCPGCDYEILHQPAVPCFSNICPECGTSLIRKSD